MKLIVLMGMSVASKTRIAVELTDALVDAGATITVIDNNDAPLMIEDIPMIRMAAGCVCCSLAGSLIPVVGKIQTQVGLLVVSALAQPDAVRQVLMGLKVDFQAVAILDDRTRAKFPTVIEALTTNADHLAESTIFGEDLLGQITVSS